MKTPLDALIEEIAQDEPFSEAESRRILEAAGIDVDAACKRLDATIARRGAALRRSRLDRARKQRERGSDDGWLAKVRQMGLSVADLAKQIAELQGQVAHRDFKQWSKEDLESELADLLALEERGEGDGEGK